MAACLPHEVPAAVRPPHTSLHQALTGLREEGGGSPAFQLVLELGDGHVLQAGSEQGKFWTVPKPW